jgi:hypothetical protein
MRPEGDSAASNLFFRLMPAGALSPQIGHHCIEGACQSVQLVLAIRFYVLRKVSGGYTGNSFSQRIEWSAQGSDDQSIRQQDAYSDGETPEAPSLFVLEFL